MKNIRRDFVHELDSVTCKVSDISKQKVLNHNLAGHFHPLKFLWENRLSQLFSHGFFKPSPYSNNHYHQSHEDEEEEGHGVDNDDYWNMGMTGRNHGKTVGQEGFPQETLRCENGRPRRNLKLFVMK